MGFGLAGLNQDLVASHQRFAQKLELGYPLLSDPETKLIQALGAWGQKKSRGKITEGPVRGTVVADAQGKVLLSYAKVKAKGHAEKLLADLAQ